MNTNFEKMAVCISQKCENQTVFPKNKQHSIEMEYKRKNV